eukprot:364898-Chlamydomonas_euryale.AAC.6
MPLAAGGPLSLRAVHAACRRGATEPARCVCRLPRAHHEGCTSPLGGFTQVAQQQLATRGMQPADSVQAKRKLHSTSRPQVACSRLTVYEPSASCTAPAGRTWCAAG